MNPRVRAGITGGIFGALIAIVSGGQVAYFAGILGGTIAGMLASQNEHQPNPTAGMRQGVQAGLIAGVLYRDFKRGRDDVTVLVVRERGGGAP